MNWSDIPFAPPARALRQFAGLWLVFCAVLAGAEAARHGLTGRALALAALALAVGPLGLWRPWAVRPVFVGSMVLTFPLAWAASRLLLACAFYGVFTPLALAFRLAGRDALRLGSEPRARTYWLPRPDRADVRGYFRQF